MQYEGPIGTEEHYLPNVSMLTPPSIKSLWWDCIWYHLHDIHLGKVAGDAIDYQLNESNDKYVPGSWFTYHLDGYFTEPQERNYDWAVNAVQVMEYEELWEFYDSVVIPF